MDIPLRRPVRGYSREETELLLLASAGIFSRRIYMCRARRCQPGSDPDFYFDHRSHV